MLEERDSIGEWYRLYRGDGARMEPFDEGRPFASWRVCRTRHCVTLRDNALWKCPPLAHLPAAAKKLALHENVRWKPYLAYEPLEPRATDDEIQGVLREGSGALLQHVSDAPAVLREVRALKAGRGLSDASQEPLERLVPAGRSGRERAARSRQSKEPRLRRWRLCANESDRFLELMAAKEAQEHDFIRA